MIVDEFQLVLLTVTISSLPEVCGGFYMRSYCSRETCHVLASEFCYERKRMV